MRNMTYHRFSNKRTIIDQLLKLLAIIEQEHLIIEINHAPDFSLSAYQKDSTTNYVFKNYWRISDQYEALFDFRVLSTKIFHYDDLIELSSASQIPFHDNHTLFLNQVYQKRPSLLEEHGFEPELDEFKLHHIRPKEIDNDRRIVEYEGSFWGDSHMIDPSDWKLYAIVEVEGMPLQADFEFYKSLIAESLSLWKEQKNKLSYFLLHAAFESFVNSELKTEGQEGRFSDKVNQLFTTTFGPLTKHEIYSSTINELKQFSKTRNAIAHGRDRIKIPEIVIQKAFTFILTMIVAYQYRCHSFEDIEAKLPKSLCCE